MRVYDYRGIVVEKIRSHRAALVEVDRLTVVSAPCVAGGKVLHQQSDCPRNADCPVYADLAPTVTVSSLDAEEWAVIHHLRGNRHDGWACPLCRAMSEASDAQRRLNSVITGEGA